jgi:hypothetical protein
VTRGSCCARRPPNTAAHVCGGGTGPGVTHFRQWGQFLSESGVLARGRDTAFGQVLTGGLRAAAAGEPNRASYSLHHHHGLGGSRGRNEKGGFAYVDEREVDT